MLSVQMWSINNRKCPYQCTQAQCTLGRSWSRTCPRRIRCLKSWHFRTLLTIFWIFHDIHKLKWVLRSLQTYDDFWVLSCQMWFIQCNAMQSIIDITVRHHHWGRDPWSMAGRKKGQAENGYTWPVGGWKVRNQLLCPCQEILQS